MDVFSEWKRLTRAFFSMKIALDREAALWSSMELRSPLKTELEVVRGLRTYRVALAEHTAAVADEHPLCAMALNLSYSLVEAFARERLKVDRLDGGIEGWGTVLLEGVGRDFTSVLGGKGGMIEVAVARSAVAHGIAITQTTLDRFSGIGATCPWPIGSSIQLTFENTQVYRDRMKSLLRICSGNSKKARTPATKTKGKGKGKGTGRQRQVRTPEQEARRALKIAWRQRAKAEAGPSDVSTRDKSLPGKSGRQH